MEDTVNGSDDNIAYVLIVIIMIVVALCLLAGLFYLIVNYQWVGVIVLALIALAVIKAQKDIRQWYKESYDRDGRRARWVEKNSFYYTVYNCQSGTCMTCTFAVYTTQYINTHYCGLCSVETGKKLKISRSAGFSPTQTGSCGRYKPDRKKCSPIEILASELPIRRASRYEYENWLEGYLGHGGEIKYRQDYTFPEDDFFVATGNMQLPHNLCGAAAINLIVPCGIDVEVPDLGHCNVYYKDGYHVRGIVSSYKDMRLPEELVRH